MDEYGYDDENTATLKASKLLYKLYVHALDIVRFGEPEQEDVCDAILDAVPHFDKDIASIIYNFLAFWPWDNHIFNVSWHRVKWYNQPHDQMGLWDLYDRSADNQHYDIFYLSKEGHKGCPIAMMNIKICNDIQKCNDEMRFDDVSSKASTTPSQRWCLGSCPSFVPNLLFSSKEYAIMIGKVLELHGLHPKLCHSIYIGDEIKLSARRKSKIVDEFNKTHASNAKIRSNRPTTEDVLHDFSDEVTSGLL